MDDYNLALFMMSSNLERAKKNYESDLTILRQQKEEKMFCGTLMNHFGGNRPLGCRKCWIDVMFSLILSYGPNNLKL